MRAMKRILVDKHPATGVVRTALLHDGRLVELIFAGAENSVAGNIYAGLVETILPNRFAFIDIGLEKRAFLNLDDRREQEFTCKQGQTVLVQALKDPAGEKGTYLTSRLDFKGRFAALSKATPNRPAIGISKKIEDAAERKRLHAMALAHLPAGMELVLRTNAAGCSAEELAAEIERLAALCRQSDNEWTYVKAPALLHSDATAADVSELFTRDVDELVVEGEELYAELANAAAGFFPHALERVRPYAGDINLFRTEGVETQIEKALQKRVWLKSGGFLVIEQTEACAVIDVNSGKFAGKKDLEQSVLKVNMEAATEIARQLRLRNLGGIIIVDFIDMKEPASAQTLTEHLAAAVKKDRLATAVVGMTELGLMQITRKKTRKPLAAVLRGGSQE